MKIITENIDSCSYTGIRNVNGKVRLKTHDEASWLDKFFDGSFGVKQLNGVTRGKVYETVRVEGLGDCEDITIIDDNGNEQTLGDFFFCNVD